MKKVLFNLIISGIISVTFGSNVVFATNNAESTTNVIETTTETTIEKTTMEETTTSESTTTSIIDTYENFSETLNLIETKANTLRDSGEVSKAVLDRFYPRFRAIKSQFENSKPGEIDNSTLIQWDVELSQILKQAKPFDELVSTYYKDDIKNLFKNNYKLKESNVVTKDEVAKLEDLKDELYKSLENPDFTYRNLDDAYFGIINYYNSVINKEDVDKTTLEETTVEVTTTEGNSSLVNNDKEKVSNSSNSSNTKNSETTTTQTSNKEVKNTKTPLPNTGSNYNIAAVVIGGILLIGGVLFFVMTKKKDKR